MRPTAPATPEPARRLSPAARWVWAAQWAGASVAALVVGPMTLGDALDGLAGALVWALPLAALVIGTPLWSLGRYSRWRWDVRAGEIDIRHGTLEVRRTLIPMPRVQHVETTRGVLEQAFGLASVAVHTAAGRHRIPLLDQADADRVRDRIAELARTESAAAAARSEPALDA